MEYFVTRNHCPACRGFLESFYNPQGGIEFEYLKEAEFILDQCRECGLIFQRQIPGAFLLNKLYREWIDPAKVFYNDT